MKKLLLCTTLLVTCLQGMASAAAVAPAEVRIELLEKAFSAATAKDAVNAWAKGLQDRNGAIQYAYLSKELRAKYYFAMEELNWVTGGSSPWVERFAVTKENKLSEQKVVYDLTFEVTDSSKLKRQEQAKVTAVLEDKKWVISDVVMDKDGVVGVRSPYLSGEFYLYEEEDFSLALPSSWKGKLKIVKDEELNRTGFLYKGSGKDDGALFGVERIALQDWNDWGQETGMHTYLGERNGIVYALVKASEIPYAGNPDGVEYQEALVMMMKVKELVNSFSVRG
ncbi:hypothetical protein [Ammoniphilus resinae]|uniref:Uncharacterized protein n=1 Tax=Ammoniphilus resinae TaxID=861532 RepID=A0ABS4GUW8_9BACL|nr:hypothetical protein [Ammoniphilus resinae]MBP1934051.1 hypothetical protein [Ammoniphilus resinae]